MLYASTLALYSRSWNTQHLFGIQASLLIWRRVQCRFENKRALRVIFGWNYFNIIWKSSNLFLHTRRKQLTRNVFQKLLGPSNCLHYLIPEERNNGQLGKLINHTPYSPPFIRTNKFKNSFLLNSLALYIVYIIIYKLSNLYFRLCIVYVNLFVYWTILNLWLISFYYALII